MTKRFLRAFTSAAAMAAILACSVSAAVFTDVADNTAEGSAIKVMYDRGYIQGFGDGTFRPQATLTRAEFVTIINKMYGYKVEAKNIFSDIHEKSWYYADVMRAVAAGYIKGMGDGTFHPNEAVTREQVCVMLDSILKTERLDYSVAISDTVSDWARDSVEKLISNRLFTVEDGGRFRATEPITRGEACVALEKCVIDAADDFGDIDMDGTVREELEKKLTNLIAVMKDKVIPCAETENSKKVAQMITDSLEAYLADPNYDYKAATDKAYAEYEKLSDTERTNLKTLVLNNADGDELMLLFDFFYSSK